MRARTGASLQPRRGRPRKFSAPSRAVTVTLPEHVIAALSRVDRDLSRAVVRVTQPQLTSEAHPAAELATFGRRAVIVVNPSRVLEERTGIVLVPLPDGRALISFDESMSEERLELTLRDALDDQQLSKNDADMFRSIADLLNTARRSHGVTIHQRNIIVLESQSLRNRPVPRKGRAARK